MWPQLLSFGHFTNTATPKAGQDKTLTDNLLNQVTYTLHLQMEVFSQYIQHGSGKRFIFCSQILLNNFCADMEGTNDNRNR